MEDLETLDNFNLIKYTGHYVLTVDRGMGTPVIFQSDDLNNVMNQLAIWMGKRKESIQ